MKRAIRAAIERAGLYYAKRRYMPCGIDWLWDVQRLLRGRRIETAFDVGANVGQTTLSIKERFPHARVHAFEPVGSTFNTLEQNVRALDGVSLHRLALSDFAGRATMTADANSPLNRLLDGAPATAAGAPLTESVATDTIDRFCAERRIARIDLLKVDAEGADLKVLEGGAEMLRDGRVAFVFAEVGFKPDDSGHVHLPVLLDHLLRAGVEPYSFYDYCRLKPPAYVDEGLGLVFANVLFVCPRAMGALE